jgi:tagatose 6-phosphate kinase
MGNILTVALNAAIDTTLTIPSSFRLGESQRAGDVLKLPGGKGVNVARALHTIGVPVHVTGLAGESMVAFMTEGLAQEGINSTFLPLAGPARTCTAIVELDRHRVTEINEPGPTITDTEAQAFRGLYETLLPQAWTVVLSGSLPSGLPDDYYALLMKRAHTLGIPTVLDTSGRSLRPGIEAQPLLVKPNAAEAQEFAGMEVRHIEDAVRVGHVMREQGARMVAMTRGSEGAILVTEPGSWWARVDVPVPLSSVGSGDAFVAGLIGRLQQAVEAGESASITAAAADAGIVMQALILAVACGAANTLRLGAGILTQEDVEHLRSMVDVKVLK